MKVWPFGAALRGEALNHRVLRWLKTVVVSDAEKAQVMRQVGIRKTVCNLEGEIAVDVSLAIEVTPKPGRLKGVPGGARRVPADWPGGVRHVGDVSLVCSSRMERGKACPGTASGVLGTRGSVPSGLNPRGAEYRSGVRRRTGP
jgi:hypothetical protein